MDVYGASVWDCSSEVEEAAAAAAAAAVLQGGGECMEELKRGPWMVDEDLILVNYIANHGEGRWNSLARCSGLKRTGKSCRLRWLNYLRPDVRRGNITAEEQLLILELHSRWGNRWSKIAQHLPGRTDNEIKNYWRTRVQKHAKQLRCDVNSKQFRDVMRYLWVPRLLERIRAASGATAAANAAAAMQNVADLSASAPTESMQLGGGAEFGEIEFSPENSAGSSSDSSTVTQHSPPPASNFSDSYFVQGGGDGNCVEEVQVDRSGGGICQESLTSPSSYFSCQGFPEFDQSGWLAGEDMPVDLWTADDIWFLQQQL